MLRTIILIFINRIHNKIDDDNYNITNDNINDFINGI